MNPRFAQCLCTFSFVVGLAACGGGGDAPPPTVNQPAVFGPFPLPCTNNNYSFAMRSPSGPVTGEPRVMQAFVTLSGCTGGTLSGVPIDWTVDGGGSIGGQVSVRTLTDNEGIATVTWVFGSGTGRQTIEAEYRGSATPRRVAISHTVLPVGPNLCAAAGGTNLGAGRTISSDETWTKAASPHFTSCPTVAACDAPVRVTNGATLMIEPGATVCVDSIRTEAASRIVALGTPSEKVFFGVRDRANHWKGLELQAPAGGSALMGPSILTHAVIENASDVKALGHPIIVEDTLMRRVVPAARAEHCATFSIQPHSVNGVAPSRVLRTVIDGLGGFLVTHPVVLTPCPALRVETFENQPLTLSVRIINSRWVGMQFGVDFGATMSGQVLLSNCEISGSAATGLSAFISGSATARVSSCNIVGNLAEGAFVLAHPTLAPLDARGNWWGDPAGPQGPKGNDVSGHIDASNPLTAPVVLNY